MSSLFKFCLWAKTKRENESVRIFCEDILKYSDFKWYLTNKDEVMEHLKSKLPTYAYINPIMFEIFWSAYMKFMESTLYNQSSSK
jgi:hypothetical protein